MEETSKENSITINGVKHTLVKDTEKYFEENCCMCSLFKSKKCSIFKTRPICVSIFDRTDCHFEILKQE